MEHVSDIELIELAAGRLDPERRAADMEHIASCPECQARREAIASTWRALGAWDATEPSHDLSAEVQEAARRETGRVLRLPRPRLGYVRRLAAALLAAAILGYAAGRQVRPPVSTPLVTARNDQELSDELHLYVFSHASPTGIPGALLDLPEPVEFN